ncbi:MAG: hypothetical protein BMS9Abin01_1999 [Gammaproteobacteria bacterium]|nr:MAG: hypothetical protein BMS9Abin01_1999 [Gammaproteobacteria bacterium]
MSGKYNYAAFDADQYDLLHFKAPKAGELAPDFRAVRLDGDSVQFADYLGRVTILEMGSITCPIYQSRRQTMNVLTAAYPEYCFIVLYVREAHPGDLIGQHQSDAEKIRRAATLRKDFYENRVILVDDLDGTAHRLYGAMPNAIFVIDAHGLIVFRSNWNDVSATKKVLSNLKAGKAIDGIKSYFKPAKPWIAKSVLDRAGNGAARDFFGSFPSLIKQNLIIRNLREFFSKD